MWSTGALPGYSASQPENSLSLPTSRRRPIPLPPPPPALFKGHCRPSRGPELDELPPVEEKIQDKFNGMS